MALGVGRSGCSSQGGRAAALRARQRRPGGGLQVVDLPPSCARRAASCQRPARRALKGVRGAHGRA
eukprot:522450-Alexandrium_andersonii.AAC.1